MTQNKKKPIYNETSNNSFPKSLPDLTNLFQLKELIYMTRDLTDQKGCGSSKAIRWYRYPLP